MIKTEKPQHRQLKYLCDNVIVLLAEKASAAFVHLLQLCLRLELLNSEHVLMGTGTMMSVPFCPFAKICFQGREKLSVIFPYVDRPI